MKRAYRQGKRAEAAAETRRRIVEAAVALYASVGPRLTTVAEIARRAGVERLTVYNHFPSEAELAGACHAHWLALHPRPDFEAFAATEKRGARLRAALDALYRWYEATEPMTANVARDAAWMPSLAAIQSDTDASTKRLVEILLPGWDDRERVRASLSAAIDFATWQLLVRRSGVAHEKAVELAVDWVKAA